MEATKENSTGDSLRFADQWVEVICPDGAVYGITGVDISKPIKEIWPDGDRAPSGLMVDPLKPVRVTLIGDPVRIRMEPRPCAG